MGRGLSTLSMIAGSVLLVAGFLVGLILTLWVLQTPAAESEPSSPVEELATSPSEAEEPDPSPDERLAEPSAPRAASQVVPAEIPPADELSLPPSATFSVQIGAYSVRETTETRLQMVLAEGLEAYLVPITTSSGEVLSAIRFGSYTSREAALEAARDWISGGPGREAIVRPGS